MFSFFSSRRDRAIDEALDAEITSLHRLVKASLQPEDRRRLYDSLLQIREIGVSAVASQGLDRKLATRIMKKSAIAQMIGFQEVEDIFRD